MRSGRQIQKVLKSPDPWDGDLCERLDCLPCKGSTKDRGECRSKNTVYETVCQLCKRQVRDTKYVGETSRSLYERGLEHWKDCTSQREKSHMHQHMEEAHGESERPQSIQDVAQRF